MQEKSLQLENIFQKNVGDFFSLKKFICSQIEYYFSDANIIYDTYMQKMVQKNSQGYVSLKEFLKFNKIKRVLQQFTNYFNFKLKILQVSLLDSETLELSDNRKKVRRKVQWNPTKKSLENLKKQKRQKTLYVESVGQPLTQQEIHQIFKFFGKILTIDFPRIRNVLQTGWCFIEFQTPQEAQNAFTNFYTSLSKNFLEGKGQQIIRIITYDCWKAQKNVLLEYLRAKNQQKEEDSNLKILIKIHGEYLGITKNQIVISLMQCGIGQFQLDLFSKSQLLLQLITQENLEVLKDCVNNKKEFVNWIKSIKIMDEGELKEYSHHKKFHQETVAKKKQIEKIKQNLITE